GLADQLFPLVDEKLPLLGLEAGVRFERLKLVAGVVERLGAELRELAIVRHAAEQVSDDAAQLLELVARLRGICQGIDRLRALLDLLLQVGRVLGELLDLARVFLDRREGVGVGTRVLCARGRNSEYSCNERNAERTPDIAQARHGADHGHLPRQMRMGQTLVSKY